jgi:hypothetical protein
MIATTGVRAVAGTAILAAVLFAANAQAQDAAHARSRQLAPPGATDTPSVLTTPEGYSVWFPVDKLEAPLTGTAGIVVRGHSEVWRTGLLRPRTQFVTEMLKTVENL